MDLCFYKSGYAWFAASSHEEWNALYTDDDRMIDELRALGLTIIQEDDTDDAKLLYDERIKKRIRPLLKRPKIEYNIINVFYQEENNHEGTQLSGRYGLCHR